MYVSLKMVYEQVGSCFETFHLIDILSLISRFGKRYPTPVNGTILNPGREPRPFQATVRLMTSLIVLAVEIDAVQPSCLISCSAASR